MRLPKPLYESLPFLYGLGGALLLLIGYLLRPGARSSWLSVLGFCALILSAVIWLRRRDFRASRGEYAARNPDDSDPLR